MTPHMRTIALFSLLLVFLTPGCNRPPQQPPPPEYQVDYPIAEIMEHIIMPNADALWSSVQTTVTLKGIDEKVPRTNDDWDKVRHYAVTIVEATNLLLMPGRHVDRPGVKAEDASELAPEQIEARIKEDPAMWAAHVRKLHDVALLSIKAIDMKSPDGMIDAGDLLDQACEECHLIYWYPPKAGSKK